MEKAKSNSTAQIEFRRQLRAWSQNRDGYELLKIINEYKSRLQNTDHLKLEVHQKLIQRQVDLIYQTENLDKN